MLLKVGQACEREAAVLICTRKNVTVTRVQDSTNYKTVHRDFEAS